MSGDGERKNYTASDIKTISLSENVLTWPEMYWGTQKPKIENAIELIVEQLNIMGCTNVAVLDSDSWAYVGAYEDWVSSGVEQAGSINNLFERGTGFPEAGHNSLRFEFLIYTFSENVILWRNNSLMCIKGECGDIQKKYLNDNCMGMCCVAFNGNVYSKR